MWPIRAAVWTVSITLLLFAFAASAFAAGPVNPATASWTAPTTNNDPPIFSPLTDLASYRVYSAVGATQPPFPGPAWTVVQTVPSATPSPAPNTTVSSTLPALSDGQRYMVVTAVDTAGNESGASNVFPFVVNRTAPAPPTNLILN